MTKECGAAYKEKGEKGVELFAHSVLSLSTQYQLLCGVTLRSAEVKRL